MTRKELEDVIAKELAWKYGTRNEADRYDGIAANLIVDKFCENIDSVVEISFYGMDKNGHTTIEIVLKPEFRK